jgi:hypothetical protein
MELQMIRLHWPGCTERKKWMHTHAHITASKSFRHMIHNITNTGKEWTGVD